MMNNKLPLISLAILFGLACLGLGIRQGMQVGEANARNKISYEEKVRKLTPTITPAPVLFKYMNITDNTCGVSYLLPDNISSDEARVSIVCQKLTASQEAKMEKDGYVEKSLSGNKSIWLKSEKDQMELVRRTLEETVK